MKTFYAYGIDLDFFFFLKIRILLKRKGVFELSEGLILVALRPGYLCVRLASDRIPPSSPFSFVCVVGLKDPKPVP